MPKSTESAEDRLIARYFRPLATAPGAFGLIDDAAALTPPPGCDLVLTTDGVSPACISSDDPPANSAASCAWSDLAAKALAAGSCRCRRNFGETWLGALRPVFADDAAVRLSAYGGDTDHAGPDLGPDLRVRRRAGEKAAPARPRGPTAFSSLDDWRRGDRLQLRATDAGATLGAPMPPRSSSGPISPQPRNAPRWMRSSYASAALD
jgi:hypothetical protein